jgi:hypothetical protein
MAGVDRSARDESAGREGRGRHAERVRSLREGENSWHPMRMLSYVETLRVIQPIIPPIFAALRFGLSSAEQIHERGRFDRKRDSHFYAHAVRRSAADYLTRAGLLAEAEDDDRPELAMSSLLVRHPGVALRVYRSQPSSKGELTIPVPGRSRAKQAFWRQEQALDGMEMDNILLLWRDDEGVLVEPLTMARPVGGNHERRSLRLSWEGSLSSQMATLRAADLDQLRPAVEYPMLGVEGAG